MILEEGGKILVVYRRLFEGDEARFFVGVVDGYDSGVVKVTGHSWLKDPFAGALIEKSDLRTKIFSIASGTLIVYELPSELDLRKLRFESRPEGGLWFTDGGKFRLNLTEKEYHRALPPKARS